MCPLSPSRSGKTVSKSMVKIKVIKKTEFRSVGETPEPCEIKTVEQTNDKMASTISQWVNEREKQRQSETALSREMFFVPSRGDKNKR